MVEIHIYFHVVCFQQMKSQDYLSDLVILPGLKRLLSCFLVFWLVRVQFCFLSLLHALFSLRIFLLYSQVIHGWLNLGEIIILLGTSLFCISIKCLLNFVQKLLVGVSMELVVVNMDIIFLISDICDFQSLLSSTWRLHVLWLASYIY